MHGSLCISKIAGITTSIHPSEYERRDDIMRFLEVRRSLGLDVSTGF